ncbi:MAG: PAS domain S-box protein [Bacteroidales bacterium]|nr:PAS domain S-box protein [Bacteroidales bacterium]
MGILTIAFFSIPAICNADNDIRFSHITIKDGLPNATVSCIVQDDYGFMWFGTVDGLCKYDGYKYTTYRNDPEDSTSLSNSEIRVIFEDSNHTLWIGTRGGGLNKYIREKDCFSAFMYDENDTNSISNNMVRSIYEDKDGKLWIGTLGGLNVFERENYQFTRYLHNDNDINSLSHDIVLSICEDSNGNFWIATQDGGLNFFDRETEQFTHYKYDPGDKNSLNNNIVWCVSEDNDGNLWVSTDSGLDRIDLAKEQVVFDHYRHHDLIPQSLSKGAVYLTFTDTQHRLWIGTDNGLDLFDKENNSFIHFRHDPSNLQSLSDNQVWSICQDRTGLLWFGTHWGGINVYNPASNAFIHYKYDVNNPNGLLNKSILAFYEDKDGDIWIGVDHGGVNLLNKEKKTFKHFMNDPEDPNSLSSDPVLTFGEDSYGYLWVGTWGGGLNRFDRKLQQFKRYLPDSNDQGSLCNLHVYAILEDSRRNFWIGTHDCGLHLFNRAEDSFTHFYPDKNGSTALSSGRIWVIFEDTKENLWIGTSDGLNLLDRDTKKFKVFKNRKDDTNSLINNSIRTIFEDSSGRLWIGTSGGLSVYDYDNQSFKTYNTKDGLPNDMIGNILEDDQGNLWLGTFQGLSKFDPDTERFQNYEITDGLINDQINLRSCLKSRTGDLYFGGPDGFISFNPEDVLRNENIPPIVITGFQIFNKPVKIGADSPLREHISVTDEVILTHSDYVFSFEFSALDYTAPGQNEYKYILENFEKEWNYKSAEDRTATYTNLSPGEYLFKVKGANNDGVWNTDSASIRIIVLPPWWKTWWFRVLIVVVTASGAFSWYKMKTYSLKKWNEQLAEKNIVLNEQIEIRKGAESALRESEEKFRAFTNQATEGITVATPEGDYVFVNPAFCKMSGYSEKELLQLTVFDMKADNQSQQTFYESKETLKGVPIQVNLQRKDNTEYITEIIGKKISIRDQKLVLGTIRDITERKKAEKELEEYREKLEELVKERTAELQNANKELEAFSYSVSHDLRAPLRAIGGFTRILMKEYADKLDTEGKRLGTVIQSNSRKMSNLIDNLLSFSRLGRKSMNFTSIEMTNMVNAIYYEATGAEERKRITFTMAKLPKANGDTDMMRQVWTNLISNALKFSAQRKQTVISITCREEEHKLTYCIKDNGVGFNMKYVDKVFNVFQRLHSEQEFEGTGVGLALVQRIIHRHGGKVWAEGEVDKGAAFYFSLPKNMRA